MLDLQFPWLLLLLPIPWLVWRFAPPHEEVTPAVSVPFFTALARLAGADPRRGATIRARGRLRTAVLVAAWICTVAALSRPTISGEPVTTSRSSRDLLLAVDLSGSMATEDFVEAGAKRSRLDAVRSVLREFIARREGDRLGMVVFGAAPYVQVPFTADTEVVTGLLDEAATGMAGDQTTIGDAIGLCIRMLERSEASNRVVMLLTDGNDTGSTVAPLQAARIAAARGITIHVVGVGDPAAAGEDPLNEDVLRTIATRTGGLYFKAEDRQQLQNVYRELDAREAIEFESTTFVPRRHVFHWPLGIAVLLMLGLVLLQVTPARVRALGGGDA